MYHKVGLTAAFRLSGYEERETIVNGLSVAAKVALRLLLCNPTPSLLLTIKHKLTLFRIRRVEVLPFPIGALTKEVKEEIWLNYST
jgi:hypothetical protein